ncbi:MAG: ABC transporter ATP-binding protein/permease [Actinomycetota bacterium]|nr:ABC transporter ATP-binding protein/permease [Actinomycetota bacterium]
MRPQLQRAVAAGLLWQGLVILAPLLVGHAIDEGISKGDTRRVILLAVALGAVGVAQAWATRVRHHYASASYAQSAAHLRQRLLARAQALDAAFHERVPAGAMVTRAASDVDHIARMLDCVAHTVAYAVTIVAVTVLLLIVDPWLALVVVVGLSPLTLLVWWAAPRQRARAQRLQEAIEAAVVDTSDTATAFEVIRGLGADDARRELLGQDARSIRERGLAVHRMTAVVEPVLTLVPALALGATLLVGGHLALSGRASVGDLVAVMGYAGLLVTPSRVLGERVVTLQRALASAERLAEVLAAERQVREPAVARTFPARGSAPEVELDGVGFQRPHGPVLRGVSLRIGPGERVAVVGPPGSGKSTLLRLVAREYDADEGDVSVRGVDVRRLPLCELRRTVALVDEAVLFDDSVEENVAYGAPSAPRGDVEEAARSAAAHSFVVQLARGYATRVGLRGEHLSGGQRQRLALARALLPNSPVLLLDDVTTALDPATEAAVVTALDQETQGRTLLAVTSRPAVLSLADRVLLLDRGQVVGQGRHEDLLRTSDTYRALLAEATVAGQM